ncbi:MAG TPA: 2'-5' RNA ligase family protein [Chitinophagaceae bacterium]|jgi:2'-5' RNA ligase
MAWMYFIAVVAPKEINEEVLNWKLFMKDRFDCSVALRSPAHITLIPPSWMEETLEKKLMEAITNFSIERWQFKIEVRNFAAFKPRVIYLDVLTNKSLTELHTQLQGRLLNARLFPIKPDDRPFHPHITIATRDLRKKDFQEAWEVFKEKKFDATWMANGISLLRHDQKNWNVLFTSQFK